MTAQLLGANRKAAEILEIHPRSMEFETLKHHLLFVRIAGEKNRLFGIGYATALADCAKKSNQPLGTLLAGSFSKNENARNAESELKAGILSQIAERSTDDRIALPAVAEVLGLCKRTPYHWNPKLLGREETAMPGAKTNRTVSTFCTQRVLGSLRWNFPSRM